MAASKAQAAVGQWDAIARDVAALVKTQTQGNTAHSDFIKEIGARLLARRAGSAGPRRSEGLRRQGPVDRDLTTATSRRWSRRARFPAKNLTGTLSILGQAYVALGQTDKAAATFAEVVKADPASPDANAGLARIAQSRKDYKDALDLWSRVEATAAQSDQLWYEAKYNMAQILAVRATSPARVTSSPSRAASIRAWAARR